MEGYPLQPDELQPPPPPPPRPTPANGRFSRVAGPRPHDPLLDLAPLVAAKSTTPDLELRPAALNSLVPPAAAGAGVATGPQDFEGFMQAVPTQQDRERRRKAERALLPLLQALREYMARMNLHGPVADDRFDRLPGIPGDSSRGTASRAPPRDASDRATALRAARGATGDRRPARGRTPPQRDHGPAGPERAGGGAHRGHRARWAHRAGPPDPGAAKLPSAALFQETKPIPTAADSKDALTLPALQDRLLQLSGQAQSLEEHQANAAAENNADVNEMSNYLNQLAHQLTT